MAQHLMQLNRLGRLLCLVALIIPGPYLWASVKKPAKHLFLLSGQSNMTGGLKAGFTQTVEGTFGEDNVVVVHHSKSGRGIRFWDKEYTFPDNYRFPGKGAPSEQTKLQHGQEYEPLIDQARKAFQGKRYDTVTFIWMQGESDGMRGLGTAYEKSFLRLLARMKNDLGRRDISFVIGRINDSHINDPNWKAMREVQVKLAEDTDHGAWIDTDDLGKPEHGVHFPKENYQRLGQRFAEKAITLIRKRTAISTDQSQ